MVPIAKIIKMDPKTYAAYLRFPMGAKVFVNATVNFIDTVGSYKKKCGDDPAAPAAEIDLAQATVRKNELVNTLKMLLTILKKILVEERK